MFKRRANKYEELLLDGISIEIVRKEVKNINLRVYPSRGEVRISAPKHLQLRTIQKFAESKRQWIHKHVNHHIARSKREPLTYTSGEIHLFRGKKIILQIREQNHKPGVQWINERDLFIMTVRPETAQAKRQKVLEEWYRAQLKRDIKKLVAKWEPVMGVQVNEFGVKKMKTRWGSCNIGAKRIWLNLELAKKSPACLESVVVHEMVHLLERLHNKRFYRLLWINLCLVGVILKQSCRAGWIERCRKADRRPQ